MLALPFLTLAGSPEHVACPPALRDHCLESDVDWMKAQLPLNDSLTYIRSLLQSAVEVEHSTIPPYLTAMYSIRNASSFAATTIRSIIIEEMLHMTAAANVLNAVGGSPSIDQPEFIPTYPSALPMINVNTSIRPFDKASVETFMLIERPPFTEKSISDVYEYIIKFLTNLCARYGEQAVFTGDRALQVSAQAPGIGERASKIFSLADATQALLGVAHQGGGCPVAGGDPEDTNTSAGELGGGYAHFARFTEILDGRLYAPNDTATSGPRGAAERTDWDDVYRFAPNPRVADFAPGSRAHELTLTFASNYTALLAALHKVFNGSPGSLGATLGQMYALRGAALNLMQTADPRGNSSDLGLGPTWEYIPSASQHAVRHGLASDAHV